MYNQIKTIDFKNCNFFLKKKLQYLVLFISGNLGICKLNLFNINLKITSNLKIFTHCNTFKYQILLGFYYKIIKNSILDLCVGYKEKFIILGLEYKIFFNSNVLQFFVGYNHAIEINIPIQVFVMQILRKPKEKKTILIFVTFNRWLFFQIRTKIEKVKKPNLYTKKGIFLAEKVNLFVIRQKIKKIK